jgi:hypothetical protein
MERSAIRDGHSAFAIPGFRCAPSGLRTLVCRILDCFAEPVIGRRFAPTRWFAMTENALETITASCAGLTRASIGLHKKHLTKKMDCRVKPGSDG